MVSSVSDCGISTQRETPNICPTIKLMPFGYIKLQFRVLGKRTEIYLPWTGLNRKQKSWYKRFQFGTWPASITSFIIMARTLYRGLLAMFVDMMLKAGWQTDTQAFISNQLALHFPFYLSIIFSNFMRVIHILSFWYSLSFVAFRFLEYICLYIY